MIWSHLCRNDSWSIWIFNMQLIRTDGFVQKRKYSWLREGAKVAILWKAYMREKESAGTAGQESSCRLVRHWPVSVRQVRLTAVPEDRPAGHCCSMAFVSHQFFLRPGSHWECWMEHGCVNCGDHDFIIRVSGEDYSPKEDYFKRKPVERKPQGMQEERALNQGPLRIVKRNWFVVLGNAGSVTQPELNQTVLRWNEHTHTILSKRDNQQGPTG